MPGEPFLAVDVGASWIKSGVVRDGEVEEIAREPVARGLDALVAQLARLVEDAAAPRWGLCVAGLVDAEAGVLRYSANLGLRDAPLRELLRPDVLANDLDAAAVGEADGGTLALLQLGTGIAGRYVVDGRVVPSASGRAGEVGHLLFRPGGLECSCGKRGCAEAYAGWGAISRRHERLDDLSDDELADALDAIGFAAAALVAAHDPGVLRLGGGVAAAWRDRLPQAVAEALQARVLPDVAQATTVEPARLGDAAALIGLARSAR